MEEYQIKLECLRIASGRKVIRSPDQLIQDAKDIYDFVYGLSPPTQQASGRSPDRSEAKVEDEDHDAVGTGPAETALSEELEELGYVAPRLEEM